MARDDATLRYASALAQSCGLQVTVEDVQIKGQPERRLCTVWRGSARQFRALWLIRPNDRFETMVKWQWVHPMLVRGYMYRIGPDSYRYVVEYANTPTPQARTKILAHAKDDRGYQRFKRTLLVPVAVPDDEGDGMNMD